MKHQHYILYKPYGYLSQFISNDSKQQRKKFLGSLYDFPNGTMAIGRLDEKSEGLLFLTTDGSFSNHICSHKIEKEYYAQLNGVITQDAISELEKGVEIGFNGKKYTTNPCRVKLLPTPPSLPDTIQKIRDDRHGPTSWISITLQEGKFRQVRKMTSAVGYPTLRLARVRIGKIRIEKMTAGEVIHSPSLHEII
ncbi:pseudouridine synthase [Aquimarina sp. TRL1]|uniref:pseudouridine synthase n=1 Tax=Aquimarina sp. (strain TRL1) TaxID=2736252 RepID=UPI00158CAF76|nr:pseudouridine synthase [Aquimarina sp. TRL1]QKX06592.1 pseudouridine synthase [Aquimarina sp. TRL1]